MSRNPSPLILSFGSRLFCAVLILRSDSLYSICHYSSTNTTISHIRTHRSNCKQQPCLTVTNNNDDDETEHWEAVDVDLTDRRGRKPDWDNLALNKTAQVVKVLGDDRTDTEEMMTQLALAVKSLATESLEAILFKGFVACLI